MGVFDNKNCIFVRPPFDFCKILLQFGVDQKSVTENNILKTRVVGIWNNLNLSISKGPFLVNIPYAVNVVTFVVNNTLTFWSIVSEHFKTYGPNNPIGVFTLIFL